MSQPVDIKQVYEAILLHIAKLLKEIKDMVTQSNNNNFNNYEQT